jgi:hypothetical protein
VGSPEATPSVNGSLDSAGLAAALAVAAVAGTTTAAPAAEAARNPRRDNGLDVMVPPARDGLPGSRDVHTVPRYTAM